MAIITSITKDLLEKLDACQEGIDMFVHLGLEGFPIDRLDDIEGDIDNYVVWLRNNIGNAVIEFTDNIFKVTKGDYWEKRTYDNTGNCLSYEDSKCVSWKKTYDSNGNCLTFEDSGGVFWKRTYDSDGNCLTFENNDGLRWKKTYDSNGNCLTYTDNGGVFWKKTYDSDGNCLTYEGKDSSWRKAYDSAVNCLTYEDGSGYRYDLSYRIEGDKLIIGDNACIIPLDWKQNNN